MPPKPLIKSRAGQRVAIAAVMGVVLALSVLGVWMATGASWAMPGSATRIQPPTQPGNSRTPTPAISADDLPFTLPAGWTPTAGRTVEALGDAPQAVFTDPSRPSRWVRFLVVTLRQPIKPDDTIQGVAKMMWSDTPQEPTRPVIIQQAGAILGATFFLAPSDEEAQGVGDLDLFAVITPDARQYWVLHLRDTITDRAERDALIDQDTQLLERFYHQAMTHAAASEPTQ